MSFPITPILEIALRAGYESQQSFTDSFRAMYKKASNQYREEAFYPLQLRYVLNENPANPEGKACWQREITFATEADIPDWMDLVRLVIDGFPRLDEGLYLGQLRKYIRNRRELRTTSAIKYYRNQNKVSISRQMGIYTA